jgi:molybdate transport system substrate-binding protein
MSTWSRIAAWATMLFLGALVAGTGAMAREITVVSTAGPMPIVMGALIPIFERATGNKVVIKFEGVPQIYALLKEGADLDLVIAEEDVIQELVKRGDIADNSKIMLSRVDIAVRAGAPKPDIGTADALKAALIAAKSVAYSQDASGRHFVTMISRLKLANTLGPKSIIVQDKPVAAAVAAAKPRSACSRSPNSFRFPASISSVSCRAICRRSSSMWQACWAKPTALKPPRHW